MIVIKYYKGLFIDNQILQGVIDITAAWASGHTADVNATTIHNLMNIAYDELKQLEEKERKSNG